MLILSFLPVVSIFIYVSLACPGILFVLRYLICYIRFSKRSSANLKFDVEFGVSFLEVIYPLKLIGQLLMFEHLNDYASGVVENI